MEDKKKPYTPPTITNLGSIVVQTKGDGGFSWEPLMRKQGLFDVK